MTRQELGGREVDKLQNRIYVWLIIFCAVPVTSECSNDNRQHANQDDSTAVVTLLFTNDLEGAYEPTPAYWRNDMKHIGGVAQLTSLINDLRAKEPNVFLFDSGDIFTGTLSKRTLGEVAFELMLTMGYDAMCIGNHEFEYGWKAFAEQKNRASFPVLGANLFYRGTDIPYAQPYTILERGAIRIGVIGILGQDAATALIPSNIAGVEVRDPVPIVAQHVERLRDDVDVLVLLTHQGKTAPMQTDDEGRPDVQRDIEVDIELAGSVDGIDVLLGGHADAGTRKPVVHPRTGTLIMQTFGQGQHLGFLQLMINRETGAIEFHDGKLIDVDSDSIVADSTITGKLDKYRGRHEDIFEVVGEVADRLNRQYNLESDLGNLFADVVREHAGAPIGLIPSGALRKDLPKGPLTKMDLLNAFPFTDRVAVLELPGSALRAVLEQGLSLERGILQVSGLTAVYDPTRPVGGRVISITVGGEELDEHDLYRVATIEILAQGGDSYSQVNAATSNEILPDAFADVLDGHFRSAGIVPIPDRGRLVPVQ